MAARDAENEVIKQGGTASYLALVPNTRDSGEIFGIKRGYMTVTYDQFSSVDIRVGRIVAVDEFPEARKPAYKLTIDFGPTIGTKRSSAQVKKYYTSKCKTYGFCFILLHIFDPRIIFRRLPRVHCPER